MTHFKKKKKKKAGLPWCKESACQCSRSKFEPWVGKTPGGGHGNPLRYSCLENPKDREARRAIVRGIAKSWTGFSDYPTTTTKSLGKLRNTDLLKQVGLLASKGKVKTRQP